ANGVNEVLGETGLLGRLPADGLTGLLVVLALNEPCRGGLAGLDLPPRPPVLAVEHDAGAIELASRHAFAVDHPLAIRVDLPSEVARVVVEVADEQRGDFPHGCLSSFTGAAGAESFSAFARSGFCSPHHGH